MEAMRRGTIGRAGSVGRSEPTPPTLITGRASASAMERGGLLELVSWAPSVGASGRA
jgi:hypothetical protein